MIKKGSCSGANIINTENARVRERRECISEASVTYMFKCGLQSRAAYINFQHHFERFAIKGG